jgi:chromosome partitioning protein
MRVLAFVSEMPGTGKTVLAGHVAAQAAAEGIGPVVLIDGDSARESAASPEPGQSAGLTAWWQARAGANPILGAWDGSVTAEGLLRLAAAGVALVVIDTPSGPSAMTAQAITLANLVVLPIRPETGDLETARAVVDRVEALHTPFVFVINHSGGEEDYPTEAIIALAQHGTVCPVILPQRGDFAAGQAEGRTVMEIDADSASSEDMARLWDYLFNHIAKVAPETREDRRGGDRDRRKFPRHTYDQIATFTLGGMVFPCQIQDISAGGVSILAPAPPVQGRELILHVPYLGEFRAEPVHVDGEHAGLKFLCGAQAQAQLVNQLATLFDLDQDLEAGDLAASVRAPDAEDQPQAASA